LGNITHLRKFSRLSCFVELLELPLGARRAAAHAFRPSHKKTRSLLIGFAWKRRDWAAHGKDGRGALGYFTRDWVARWLANGLRMGQSD